MRRLPPRHLLLFALMLGMPLLVWFGPVLAGNRHFVFRDAAHFYYPLFQHVTEQWDHGLPLWTDQEELGRPLLADATASVLYPGKLLFALPLPYARLYHVYIVLHLVLAAITARTAARVIGSSQIASLLAAISYACGGAIAMQYCNVIYLVGAAWLPLTLAAGYRLIRDRQLGNVGLLAISLAMMVLGGDPQSAYHAGLAVGLWAWIDWRAARSTRSATAGGLEHVSRGHRRLPLLAASALLAMMLAAVQIVPAANWASRSGRALSDQPRSVYQLLQAAWTDGVNLEAIGRAWTTPPDPDAHAARVFHFSQGPWRWLELIWPNLGGRQYPVHQRWFNAIPAEGRVWTPTLYMGLLPLLLAVSAGRLRGGEAVRRWLTWLALLSAVGSLGRFGLGWVIGEFQHAAGLDGADVWPPIGGLYWLMTILLPKYGLFRYPAKLWMITALAISLLAARGMDCQRERPSRHLAAGSLALAGFSLIAAILLIVLADVVRSAIGRTPADTLLGPIHPQAAYRDILVSLGHTTVMGLFLAWGLRPGRAASPRWLAALLLVTAFELTVANGWIVATSPSWQQQTSLVAQAVRDDQKALSRASDLRIYRTTSRGWYPQHWKRTGSPRRQIEGQRWDRHTLLPRYHLLEDLPLLTTNSSSTLAEWQAVQDLLAQQHETANSPWDVRLLEALHVGYVVDFRADHPPRDAETILSREYPGGEGDRLSVYRLAQPMPRAWLVHRWQRLPPLDRFTTTTLSHRTKAVFLPGGQPRDLRHEAVVETPALLPDPPDQTPAAGERCQIVNRRADALRIGVELQQPGLLVLSDLYDPGWICQVADLQQGTTQQVPILRTNRVMRGVFLQPGRYHVQFQYRPAGVLVGGLISLAGWGILGLVMLANLATGVRRRIRAASRP